MHYFNEVISNAKFPDILKSAEVKPVLNKKFRIDKGNCRPVRILPVISKLFERLIFKQLTMFFAPVFSKYQCGFWKGQVIVHHTVRFLWLKSRKCLDRNGVYGALLTNLSKAFDCLQHSLLIVKLYAYGFDKTSTGYLKDYFCYRKQ